MKCLLIAIHAKYIHSNPAVYSLRAYAGEAYAEEIEIAEYTINHRMEHILADLYARKPDIMAFSCYIWNWRMVAELIGELPKLLPGVPIWLGGPEVSFESSQILQKYASITGIMIGEGEQTFKQLLQYYRSRYKGERQALCLKDIKGIVYREGEAILETGERELTDINAIPFFYQNLDDFRNRIVYYESSRGCPFRCSYCLSSIDKKVRFKEIEKVKQELDFFLEHQVPQVKFIDRTFNSNHQHALEIWKYLQQKDNGVTNFHFEVAADLMGEEEIELLAQMRPGLVQLEIGVQSANPNTLAEINRKSDKERLAQVVERLRKPGNIHIHLDLIAGLPWEDYQSFGESFNYIYSMRPEQLQLGFLKLLKGSPLYEKAKEYGINYTSEPPYEVLYSDWMNYEEICRLKQIEEMVELYYNSNQFTATLNVLEKAVESPFALFEQLADYYKKEGYFIQQPSRSYRYEVLLQFALTIDGIHEELYRELLTYDIYLRENMKSRPAFVPVVSSDRERIRCFYESGRPEELLSGYQGCSPSRMARITHAELFTYPVWEEKRELPQKLAEPVLVLFDYQERNPLTHGAKVYIVNI